MELFKKAEELRSATVDGTPSIGDMSVAGYMSITWDAGITSRRLKRCDDAL